MNENISLKEIILIIKYWSYFLFSKRLKIFIVGLIGALIGLGYSLISKPTYTATLTFALEEKSSSSGGIGAIASQFGFNIGGSDGGAFAGDNLIELLKSRNIIEKTLLTHVNINGKKELLVNRYIEFNNLDKEWDQHPILKSLRYNLDFKRDQFTLQQDSVLGVIYNNINENLLTISKVDKKLSIVKVTVISKDELFAKLFTDNIVKNVADFYVETKTLKSRGNISLLEHRVDSVRGELDAAMYGRAQFSDQNMSLVRQSAAVPKVKQEMKVQMLSTMYTELIKNLEFSKLALMREEPLIQIIDRPILPLEVSKPRKMITMFIGFMLFALLATIIIAFKKMIEEYI